MADNLTVTRIVELAKLLQKEGTLYVPVYKQEDDRTYRILVDLLGGATDTTLQWNSQDNYNNGEIREWDLKLWKSKITDGVTENIGNIPAENSFWTEVSKAEGAEGLSNYTTGVYTVNPSLVIQNKALFLLDTTQVTMPYQSTDFTSELNAGVWIKLSNNFVRDAGNQSLSPSTLGDKLDMKGGGILNYRSRELNLSGSNNISITAQGGDTYKQSNPGFGLSDTLIIPDATLTGDYGRKLSFYLNGSSGAGGQLVISTETGQLIGGQSSQTIGIDNTGFTVLESNGEWLIIQDSRPKPSLSSLIIYATLANVTDPASYFKLVISLNDPDYSQIEQLTIGPTVTADSLPTFQGAWTFESDIIQGVIPATNSTARLKLRQASGSADIVAYYEIYKRDVGGTETLINTSPNSPILSGTQEVYELTAFIPEQNLEPGDRLVWKFYGQKVGGTVVSVGTIEFTTGGLNQPAEITFPIPGTSLSIEHGDTTNRNLPNQHNTDSVQQDTDLPNFGIEAPETLNNVLLAINNKKLWEPEQFAAATTDHPRWDDSLDGNIFGTDKFNFNALPAGTRAPSGSYSAIGEYARFWTLDAPTAAWRELYFASSILGRTTVVSEEAGQSLRLVRAYAPADGEQIDGRIIANTFSDFDGNTYDGVIIGDQVWSTTNLKTTSYADGTPIPTGYSDVDWSNLTTGAYAVYDHTLVAGIDSEAEMIAAYGRLYNWYAVDNVLGLSNDGAVPTDAQFTQFTNYIETNYPDIDSTNIGDALKSIRQVNSPFIATSNKYVKPKVDPLTNEQRYVKAEWIEGGASGGLSSTWEDNITAIRAITDYSAGIDVGNYTTGIIYKFDATSTVADDGVDVLKPDNILSGDTGRWVNKISIVKKATQFSENNLKKFDANGNDEDSGLTGNSLDIYNISASLISDLMTESNWIDGSGNPITTPVLFSEGTKGQRYYSENYFFECTSDFNWQRTFTGIPVIDIYNNPNLTLTDKGNLENAANWSAKAYIGPAINNVVAGTRYYDNDYVYEFVQNNLPVRYSRV